MINNNNKMINNNNNNHIDMQLDEPIQRPQ
jgi:hypothetical protein